MYKKSNDLSFSDSELFDLYRARRVKAGNITKIKSLEDYCLEAEFLKALSAYYNGDIVAWISALADITKAGNSRFGGTSYKITEDGEN
jgi:hypothetical protein